MDCSSSLAVCGEGSAGTLFSCHGSVQYGGIGTLGKIEIEIDVVSCGRLRKRNLCFTYTLVFTISPFF